VSIRKTEKLFLKYFLKTTVIRGRVNFILRVTILSLL
jgi:hypothetical protein